MMTILGCIVYRHNPWLVLVAALICGAGSWAMVRMFLRAAAARAAERAAWLVLTASLTGAAIWCTHFVAMIGYDPGLPIDFAPVLTIVSLLVAMGGSGVGFLIASARFPGAQLLGGATVGLAIVVMHYTGMVAYRVRGIVSWDVPYLVASIAVACALAAAALHVAVGFPERRARAPQAAFLLFLSITGLHFTGMTAFRVEPMLVPGSFSNPETLNALAIAVACVGLVIVGAGLASSFLDTQARAAASDALANMSNGLVMVGPDGRITLFNQRVLELFDLPAGAVEAGMPLDRYLEAIGRKAGWEGGRVRRVVANHREWMAATTVTRVEHHFDDGLILSITCQPVGRGGAILTYENVTEARNGQKTIAHMAFHDALTGLKNRRMFAAAMDALLQGERSGLLMIDLDRFKAVNDRFGHAVGDGLLQEVARRLEAILRPGEQAFRIGGDELAALVPDGAERAVALAGEIVGIMTAPFEIAGHALGIGCSIGVAAAAAGDDASRVQRKADLALYAAKKAGRSRFETYREGSLEAASARRWIEEDLAGALASNQLELHFQPLYALPERSLKGFEALVRWRHPERGLISPADFVPVAEECGMIRAIGAWIIEAACRQAALWPSDLYISINVSAVQLRSATLPMQVYRAMTRYGLPPSRIEIEITETAMVEDGEQIALTLAGLRVLGVRIAMDDFGTGYSSLAHLREFKVDRIKIDRSFVAAFASDPGAAAIVRAVLGMARELQIATTAEGVEDEAQLASLVALRCGTAQGFLLGRPLDAAAADRLATGEPAAAAAPLAICA